MQNTHEAEPTCEPGAAAVNRLRRNLTMLRAGAGLAVLGIALGAVTGTTPGAETADAADTPAAEQTQSFADVAKADIEILAEADAERIAAEEAKKARKKAKAKAARAAAKAEARARAEAIASAKVIGTRYTTAGVNVRTEPSTDGDVVTTLRAGASVKVTDNTEDGFRQVKVDGKDRWIKSSFLTKTKPRAASTTTGVSSAVCKHGSAVEKGLNANAIKVHRAVCAAFPSVTSYGGIRSGSGNHANGRALDIMVSGKTGDAIAAYVRSNAKRLGVSEVIWAQKIWTVQRSGEGWRGMSDRGSATANHYDHVHVSVY